MSTLLDQLEALAESWADDTSPEPHRSELLNFVNTQRGLTSDDAHALDRIAVGMGTRERWSADELEWIANIVGEVRPHPGDAVGTYVGTFETATGRTAPADMIDEPDDDTIGATS